MTIRIGRPWEYLDIAALRYETMATRPTSTSTIWMTVAPAVLLTLALPGPTGRFSDNGIDMVLNKIRTMLRPGIPATSSLESSRVQAPPATPEPSPAVPLPGELRSIGETEEADIFLVGYPKSGNTWLQCCVAALRYGLDIARTPDALVQTIVPDVHFRPYYTRLHSPTCFKTHEFPKPSYRRVIYILRDGRDVMTSYYHHLRAVSGNDNLDWGSVVVKGDGLFPGRWCQHIEDWQRNPYDAEMLTIRYEDLKNSTVETLDRIAAFVGVERSREELQYIATTTTFSRMQKREREFVWSNPAWPKEHNFVRRGDVGSYKDEMPPDVLSEFEMEIGDTLAKMGYVTTAPNTDKNVRDICERRDVA